MTRNQYRDTRNFYCDIRDQLTRSVFVGSSEDPTAVPIYFDIYELGVRGVELSPDDADAFAANIIAKAAEVRDRQPKYWLGDSPKVRAWWTVERRFPSGLVAIVARFEQDNEAKAFIDMMNAK